MCCWLKIFWYPIVVVLAYYNPYGFFEGWRTYLKKEKWRRERCLKYGSKHTGKWRPKLLVGFILFGIAGSISINWYLKRNVSMNRKALLTNMCEERSRMLQDQFNVSMNHVHALSILVSTFHHGRKPSALNQQIFAHFTERTAFERPLTSGVAYAVRVRHSEREQVEKLYGWKIRKMGIMEPSEDDVYNPDKLDPAPVQNEYAPVIFAQETVSHIVSIDMMTGKEDRDNIMRARSSGKGVLTSPFPLLKSNHLGVILTFAVYNQDLPEDATDEQRIEATEGYIGASYDIPSMVDKLLDQLSRKELIIVNVYDTTDASAPITMYGPNVTATGLVHISKLNFGDPSRKHEIRCRFAHDPAIHWTAIFSSVGVLMISMLISHIFHAAISRIAYMEDDFFEMTDLKNLAEAADVAKTQFLTMVSHEIRTPMNGVLGMLQMLKDTTLNTIQLDYIDTAYTSGKDLIYLLNEVLDQAKIETGRLDLDVVEFDLRAMLDNILALHSTKCRDKPIEFAAYVSSQVPKVLSGDCGRFRQVVTNLVGNSMKFTAEGHVFISVHLANDVRNLLEATDTVLKQQLDLVNVSGASPITLSGSPVVARSESWFSFKCFSTGYEPEPPQMTRLLVTVEDTGIGISEEAKERIFTPFMQADNSTTRKFGGTGIGLSISRTLVKMMSGEIGFASEEGIGSTFSFALSFEKANDDALDASQHHLANEFRGLHALIVDGKCIRAEVTKYQLQRLGVSVEIATDVVSACSYVSNTCDTSAKVRLDIVLIDKETWYEHSTLAFRELLQELRHKGIHNASAYCPKIFLLTSSRCKKTDSLKSYGFVDDIILKPLRLNMIAASFEEIILGTKRVKVQRKTSNLQHLLAGKRFLVVDDNDVNCKVAAGVLRKCGALVVCVGGGAAAVEHLSPPHEFDFCFMDLRMPVMDGYDVTTIVRGLESELNEQIEQGNASMEVFGKTVKRWHVPIIAMTADVFQTTHDKCIQLGMDGFVTKPFEEKQLYSAALRYFEDNGIKASEVANDGSGPSGVSSQDGEPGSWDRLWDSDKEQQDSDEMKWLSNVPPVYAT